MNTATWPDPAALALEPHLGPWRDRAFTLLAIGGADEAGLAPWLAQFPQAHLLALAPAPLPQGPTPSRITRLEGEPRDEAMLADLAAANPPGIVLDAAARPWPERLAAMLALWPGMPPGAVYVVLGPDPASPLAQLTEAAARLAAGEDPPPPVEELHFPAVARVLAGFSAQVVVAEDLLVLVRAAVPRVPLVPTRPARELADSFFPLDSGGPYERLPAALVDCPGWLEERFHQATVSPERAVPPGGVALLRNATVHGRGLVTAADGSVVRESLINAADAPVVATHLRAEAGRRYIPWAGTTPYLAALAGPTVLLKQMWDHNYGHWVVESLPRVGLVAEVMDLAECRFVVQAEASPMHEVYRDSLAFFGIGPERIEFTGYESFAVERLVYPLPMTTQPWVKAPRVLQQLAEFPPQARRFGARAPSPRRLFVGRGSIFSRQLLNAEEIVALVRAHGFEVILPEEHGFWDQVALFSEAEIVVGVLGAGLSNLVFSPRGVTCIGLTTEYMGDDFFYDIICHKRGRYVSLHGKATDPSRGMSSDFTLDPALLARWLAEECR